MRFCERLSRRIRVKRSMWKSSEVNWRACHIKATVWRPKLFGEEIHLASIYQVSTEQPFSDLSGWERDQRENSSPPSVCDVRCVAEALFWCGVLICFDVEEFFFLQWASSTSTSVTGYAACLIHVGEGRDTKCATDNYSQSDGFQAGERDTGTPRGPSGLRSSWSPSQSSFWSELLLRTQGMFDSWKL